MGYLSWIIFGLIAGVIAKLIMPGKDPGGWIITIVLGIVGAFVGGYIGQLIGFDTGSGFSIRHFATAIVGTLILLGGYHLIKRNH